MQADPGAVPDQKTLALVNTYMVGVVRMLNDFTCACEHSFSTVGRHAGEDHVPLQMSTAVD
jgi:hypothetical protein